MRQKTFLNFVFISFVFLLIPIFNTNAQTNNGSIQISIPSSFSSPAQIGITVNGTNPANSSAVNSNQIILQLNPVVSCSASVFSASPNPILVSSGTTGVTAISSRATCAHDIRVGSPSGSNFSPNLPANTNNLSTTENWVTNGMVFYLQKQGDSSPSGTLATLTVNLITIPPTPTNFVATTDNCGTRRINLTWSSATGATSYNLKRNGVSIYTGASTSYLDSSLNAGTTYSYTLTATNAAGTSAQASTSGTAPLACVVSAPDVTFSANPTFMTSPANSTLLSWSATNNPTNCTASANPFNSNWNGSKAIPSGSQTISGLAVDTYTFSIYCTNTNGNSSIKNVAVTVSSPVSMSGSLTASNCTIASGASTCNTTLNWTTANPVATSAVTTPTNINVATGNSGTISYPVSSGIRTFYLYNNGVLLDQKTATASCTSGTNWDGSKCAPIVPPAGDMASCQSISISPASPTTGQTVTGTVTMQNSGTSVWQSFLENSGTYKLVSQTPQGNNTWSTTQVNLPLTNIATARYVKIEIPSSNSWVAAREIEVYDTNNTKINPISCTTNGAFDAETVCNNVFDNDITTFWISNDTAAPYSGWVTLDLGSSRNISRIRIYGESTPSPSSGVLSILTSTDNIIFTSIKSFTGYGKSADFGWYLLSYGDPSRNSTFTFTATAPSSSGTYNFDWGMANGSTAFGSVCQRSVIVTSALTAVADISANSTNIPYNTTTNISWTSTNATSCSVSPSGWTGTVGTQSTGNLTTSRTYTLSCNPVGPNSTDNVTVNVEDQASYGLNVIKSGQGTVTSSPAGINCGVGCSSQSTNFVSGTSVVLTASPASGRIFTGWSGGSCSGKGACTITLNGPTTVYANFAIDPNYIEF